MPDSDHITVGFNFSSDAMLPAIRGAGLSRVTDHRYRWDNRVRREDHCIVQYTLSGEGAVEVSGVERRVPAGRAFLADIPSDSSYYLPADSPVWEFVFFEFTRECVPYLRRVTELAGPVVDLTAQGSLEGRLLALYRTAAHRGFPTVYEDSKEAYALWMDLIAAAAAASAPHDAAVEAAKRYIDQRYADAGLGLADVARAAGVSPSHLCRAFRERFGTTPGRYLREVRINRACQLLLTTDAPALEEVARRVGYANANYFGKVFRAERGVSPAAWRRRSNRYDMVRSVSEVAPVERA